MGKYRNVLRIKKNTLNDNYGKLLAILNGFKRTWLFIVVSQ